MNIIKIVVLAYLIVMNIVGLIMMADDKHRAKTHAWRIPEMAFFIASLLGGSAGTWIGMYLFHHKTKHWYFVIGMPLILIVQIVLAVILRALFNS